MRDSNFQSQVEAARKAIRASRAKSSQQIDDIETLPVTQHMSHDSQVEAAREMIRSMRSQGRPQEKSQDNWALDQAARIGLLGGKGALETVGGLGDLGVSLSSKGGASGGMGEVPSMTPSGSIDPITGKKDIFKRREDLNREIEASGFNGPDLHLHETAGGLADKIYGRELKPENTAEELAHTTGQFAVPFGGGVVNTLKLAPKIAVVSQLLKEAGLNDNMSDLVSAVTTPNISQLSKVAGSAGRKAVDYAKTIASRDYREAGALEEAARFLQGKVGEEGLENAIKSIESHVPAFEGHNASTAEIVQNPGLSQYYRAKMGDTPSLVAQQEKNMGVLRENLDNIASRKANPQMSQEFADAERLRYSQELAKREGSANRKLEESVSEFSGNRPQSDEAGKEVQSYLHDRTKSIRKQAQKETHPIYESAKKKTLDSEPESSLGYIDEMMPDWPKGSPSHSDLKYAKNAIENARNIVEKVGKKEYVALGNHSTFNVKKIDNAKKVINQRLQSIPPHELERRKVLSGVLENLEKDLDKIPEISEARHLYRQIMKPANDIIEHPVLGNIIKKKKGYTGSFTVTHAEIPKRVLEGERSVDAAKTLISESAGAGTQEHARLMDTLKSYVNSDILSSFVEKTGKINPSAFASWRAKNKGAFILYPELDGKLSNLQKAQKHVDAIVKENKVLLDKYYKDSMQAILGNEYKGVNPDGIANRILNSSNSVKRMEEAVELLSKDKSGNALEGLKRSVIDNYNNLFKSDKLTFATYNNYLNKNRKAFEKLFDKDQMKVLDKIAEVLKKKSKVMETGPGSDTVPKALAFKSEMPLKTPFRSNAVSFISDTWNYAKNIKEAEKLKYVEQALGDSKFAKLLFQKDVKTGQTFFDAFMNDGLDKWLRDGGTFAESLKKGLGGIKDNLGVTSEAVLKSRIAND